MPYFLVLLAALAAFGFASPARANAAATLEAWKHVQDPDSGASFDEISSFLQLHPTWPDQKKIRIRAERAMRTATLPDQQIVEWFFVNAPISGVGKWTYAEALDRLQTNDGEVTQLVKDAWRDADLTADEEQTFLITFGSRLDAEDHRQRVDRLLWDGKATQVNRILDKLSSSQQALAEARLALLNNENDAPALVARVPSSVADDPGLLYERIRYRQRKGDREGMRDLLLATPKDIPYPERWWKIRESEIRRALDEGDARTAEKLLDNHGQTSGSPYAEALWLDGWTKLEFLGNASDAYASFTRMYDVVKTPVSKARAAYWAGRAARKSGDNADSWFSNAAQHTTTFYGQLARTELSGEPRLELPDEPGMSFSSDPVLGDGLEDAIRILIRNGDNKLASRFITHVIETAENQRSILAVAAMGHALSVPHISVKAAKKAQAQNVVLKNVGYPRPSTPRDLAIERSLALAISRQESEFDPEARSSAGARGMMQLLPGTAKETARKNDLAYNLVQLSDPEYNMQLGSLYLSRMLNSYDGSYVMAIASYNAGPGNVNKWTSQFGTPGNDTYNAINWIEKIPFYETRNYVQRVLENLQVYRALEGDDTLKLREDLAR